MPNMSIPDAAVTAVMGYLVVFVGLALLMAVITIMGRIMVASQAKSKAPAAAAKPEPAAPAAAPEPKGEPAPGSAGEVKLFDVPDKEAAMLMAIVADKMGKPLNELRFKSMKEVK